MKKRCRFYWSAWNGWPHKLAYVPLGKLLNGQRDDLMRVRNFSCMQEEIWKALLMLIWYLRFSPFYGCEMMTERSWWHDRLDRMTTYYNFSVSVDSSAIRLLSDFICFHHLDSNPTFDVADCKCAKLSRLTSSSVPTNREWARATHQEDGIYSASKTWYVFQMQSINPWR
jgi:hypothetical protein